MKKITISLIKELRDRTNISILECKKALIQSNGNIEIAIDNMRKLGKLKAIKKYNNVTANGIILTKTSTTDNIGVILEINCETDFVSQEANFLKFSHEILNYALLNEIGNIKVLKEVFEEERIKLVNVVDENINIRRVDLLKGANIGNYSHGMRIGVLVSMNKDINKTIIKHIAMHIAASKPEYISTEEIPQDIFLHEKNIQLEIAQQSDKDDLTIEKIVNGRLKKIFNNITLMNQEFIIDPKWTVGNMLKKYNGKIFKFIRFEVGDLL
uniref:Elongation factor Ts n=1 Tax=Candidatus Aschnera chinzeii TaxID=1485666 RepID=A0AAT9G409_9ENTR|nr:MAG: translation elongation factor Ts [Candidatus Aschnera chinzeii]